MAQIFLTDVNLSKNELQNAAIQNLATAPASPVSGQIYFDTSGGEVKVWDGSDWIGMQDNTYVFSDGSNTFTLSETTNFVFNAGNGITYQLNAPAAGTLSTSINADTTNDFQFGIGYDLQLKDILADGGTVGSSTAIPVITYDTTGRITGASTASITTSWNITDGTNTEVISGGDTLTVNGTANEVEVLVATGDTLTIGLPSDVTIGNDLTVNGNLTVSGTTTTVNTETINLADNIITLNSNYTGSTPTENAGIEVERGTLANVSLYWDETSAVWTVDGNTIVDSSNIGSFGVSTFDISSTTTGVNVTPATASQGAVSATVDVDSASESSQGLIVIASDTEALDGTDDLKAVTPLTANLVANTIVNSKRLSRDLDGLDPLVSVDVTGTIFTVTHGMSTHDIIVQIYDKTTLQTVYADIVRDGTNLDIVKIQFATAPGDGAYRVSIIKA